MGIIVETLRTRIEKIAIDDAPFILELLQTEGWKRNISDQGITSLRQAENYVQQAFLKTYVQFGFGYYLIRLHSGDCAGIAGFLKKPYLEHEDFGFALSPDFYGQGLAYEASRAILDYAVPQFNFNAIDAVTLPGNNPSRRLLSRLGFEQRGEVQIPATDSTPEESLLLYRLHPQVQSGGDWLLR